MSDHKPAFELKNWFDEARYRSIASATHGLDHRFDSERFLKHTLEGLEGRSLMQRLRQTAMAMHESLPGTYLSQIEKLKALAPKLEHSFIAIFLSDFVASYGLQHFDASLQALRFFTRFGSAEFAIRHFLLADFEQTRDRMLTWTRDDDEHVRRLSSEGIRPRLPWGLRLQRLVQDPEPLADILDALRSDPALYVRKSVANNLNDIAKDHPEWVLRRVSHWSKNDPSTAWIIRHGCRTLIKKGNPKALKIFGFHTEPHIKARIVCNPAEITLGESIDLEILLESTAPKAQALAVDYVVHYVRQGGATTEKVFKWTELDLGPRQLLILHKKQTFKDFTTRKHYSGIHRIELQINGQRMSETHFSLRAD
jgi:3-methyladenine DNA glycosylase AlkC